MKQTIINGINKALLNSHGKRLNYSNLFSYRFDDGNKDRCTMFNTLEEFETKLLELINNNEPRVEIYIQVDDASIFKAELLTDNPEPDDQWYYETFTINNTTIAVLID